MNCLKMLGLALLAIAVGCSKPNAPQSAVKVAEPAPHSHGNGPNGGVVFDLGKYHGEFNIDHGKQQCMIVILGDDEKTPVAVDATELTVAINETKTADGKVVPAMTVTAKPQDAVGGKASTFVGTHPGIANVADFDGTVVGEIDGKPSQGQFKE